MDWLIALALFIVLAPLMIFAIASMPRRRGGSGGGFGAFDEMLDPSKRHVAQVQEERVLERDKGEPPLP